jgi:hypothetical protein
MNNRIRQLAEQATTYIEPTANSGEGWIFDKEKFAELIVRECIDIVSKVPNGYRDYRNQIEDAMRADCLQAIQEHFGVEE